MVEFMDFSEIAQKMNQRIEDGEEIRLIWILMTEELLPVPQ